MLGAIFAGLMQTASNLAKGVDQAVADGGLGGVFRIASQTLSGAVDTVANFSVQRSEVASVAVGDSSSSWLGAAKSALGLGQGAEMQQTAAVTKCGRSAALWGKEDNFVPKTPFDVSPGEVLGNAMSTQTMSDDMMKALKAVQENKAAAGSGLMA